MNKFKCIKLISLVLVLSFVFCTVGCGNKEKSASVNNENVKQENNNEEKNKIVDVIKLEGGDWGEPTPFKHYPRGPGIFKMKLIFDSLLEKDEKGIIPWLGEKWEITDGGKGIVFTIRKGVKWQDGQSMTCEDVKFSFEYFKKHPPVSDKLLIDNKSFIKSIEILDDNKIKFNLKDKNATALSRIGDVRIIPKHIWEKVSDPKKFSEEKAYIGCGPYILKEYNKELGQYRFEAFKDYWGPKQRVLEIQFVPISDANLAFEQGDIDLNTVSKDLLSRYENNKEFKIIKSPAFWGYRMIFNMKKKNEFKDKSIRQAIAYAIDKNELVKKVARGAGKVASAGYLPVDHVWYNDKVKKYDFNVDKSKKLLNGKKITFTLLTGNSKKEVRIAELMKISLKKANIDLKIKSVDMKTRDAAVKDENYEAVLIGHGGWGSDADSLRTMYAYSKASDSVPTSNGIPGYSNEKINELCGRQIGELNSDNRKKIVFQLQEVIAEEIPMIPIYNTIDYSVYRPSNYDGWMNMFDHHCVVHSKLSYLQRKI